MAESTQATINSTFQPVHNAMVPKEGPKAIPLKLDFTATQSIQVDLTQQQQSAKISFIQGAFIDNSANTAELTISTGNSQQNLIIPPQSQAYIPLLLPNPPSFIASTTGGVIVGITPLNIPMDIAVWSVNGSPEVINGVMQVSDPILDALVSGGALSTADTNLAPLIQTLGTLPGLNVNVVNGGGGGSGDVYVANAQTFTQNGTIIGGSGGADELVLDYLRVSIGPDSYYGTSGFISIQIAEGSNTYLNTYIYLPVTAPALTGISIPLLLFEVSNMSASSGALNSDLTLKIQQSGSPITLAGGNIIVECGYIDKVPT